MWPPEGVPIGQCPVKGAPHMPSAFTRSPLHLRSPNGDRACRCPKREPLNTVSSDSRGHQTNQLLCSCDGLPGQN